MRAMTTRVICLEVKDLSHRYGDRQALEGLSFEVAKGEIFGFLGPNGAGKSTAFHILTGLLPFTCGEIRLNGKTVRPSDSSYRARLGVVFQKPSVDIQLTARENLKFGAALYGIHREVAARRIGEVLQFMDLADRADEKVAGFSGGMRRRLEVARVLLHDPELLIMDEPSAGLDQATLRRLWDRLKNLCRETGLTVLVTTHHPEEAEYCDQLLVLDGGKCVAVEPPEKLKRQVADDLIVVDGEQLEELAAEIEKNLSLKGRVSGGVLLIECPDAHKAVPRIVEAFPRGRFRSVGIRTPTLGDVFAKLTGHDLASDPGGEAAA